MSVSPVHCKGWHAGLSRTYNSSRMHLVTWPTGLRYSYFTEERCPADLDFDVNITRMHALKAHMRT